MKKSFYVPLGILLFSLLLGFINKWNWQASQKPLPQNNLESVNTEAANQNNYKEFVAADKNFRINYPAAWFRLEDKNILSAFNSKEWQEKYNLKTIFLAQSFEAGKFAQVVVQEGVFDISPGEIIEEMKKNNQKQELNMEIVKSDIQNDKTIFEAKYLMTSSPNLYSKEAVIFAGDRTYLIAFVSMENDWPEFAEEAGAIINSAVIVQ